MKLLQGAATFVIAGLSVIFWESAKELHTLKVRRYPVSCPSLEGMRILFVTDYHEAVGGALNRRLLSMSKRLLPDIILIGGDMVNGKEPNEDVSPAVELINGLCKIAPVVYAYGNHECRLRGMKDKEGYDWDAYRTALDPRVLFLENDHKRMKIGQWEFLLYGLNAGREYYVRNGMWLSEGEMNYLLGERDKSLPSILLAHDPSHFKAYTDWGADLTLSGHYHGGIIRLPWVGGFISPKWDLFPKYDYGTYERNGKEMIVSSGIGQHSIPVKWCNYPELVVVDFV